MAGRAAFHDPRPGRHRERRDAAPSRRRRIRKAGDLVCGHTGLLRCANKKHRADGPSPHGFIQQTRPGAGVLRRDREAATTPHGRGPVVHSPHHAVTASAAKRPSPGVARSKSHGSRQRRHWIASLRSQRRLVFNLPTVSSNGIGRNGRCELARTGWSRVPVYLTASPACPPGTTSAPWTPDRRPTPLFPVFADRNDVKMHRRHAIEPPSTASSRAPRSVPDGLSARSDIGSSAPLRCRAWAASLHSQERRAGRSPDDGPCAGWAGKPGVRPGRRHRVPGRSAEPTDAGRRPYRARSPKIAVPMRTRVAPWWMAGS